MKKVWEGHINLVKIFLGSGLTRAVGYLMEPCCRTVLTNGLRFDTYNYHYVSFPRMLFICVEAETTRNMQCCIANAVISDGEITPETVLYTLPFPNYYTGRGVVCLGRRHKNLPIDKLIPTYFSTAFEFDKFLYPVRFWDMNGETVVVNSFNSFSEWAALSKIDPTIGSRIVGPLDPADDWVFQFGSIISK